MNVIYICRVTDFQVSGNQIDIPKKVAIEFFNVPENKIELGQNVGINICHRNDLRSFEIIEIYFKAQNIVCQGECSCVFEKNVYSAVFWCIPHD